ncbi:MAG: cobalamin B12-binding domain-containing protein [Syntrophaceae bacterium]|nr:cobalamin B12-binding domain-containing protein [Syntrophaceae bacterium]
MTSIVLVNPPYSFWSPDKNHLRPFIGNLPSLGLLSLGAVLRNSGYGVKIVESASLGWSLSRTVREILQERPAYLGLSCATASVENAAKIALAVKERNPETRVLVGGPHITALPEETLRRFPVFDFAVLGEGEAALPDLLEVLEGKMNPDRVESAVFRQGEKVRVNPRRRFIEDLDRLPFPAFDLLPEFPQAYHAPFLNYQKGPTASLTSSRGCPQACNFCDRSVFGNRYRYFSEDYLWDLISLLHRQYGIRHLVFTDDQFAAFRPRLVRLCEKLAGGGLDLRWNCDARVDSVDPDLLRIMKRAGCWMISYGIESGSQKILDHLRKGIMLDQVEQAVRWTQEAGIRAKGLFMIGYPEETEETLGETLAFIGRVRLDEMNLSFLTPYPGTEIYRQAKGNPNFMEDWARMNALNCLLPPAAVTCRELDKAYRKIIRRFYMRPGVTFSYLSLLLQSPENRSRLWAGLSGWLRRG